jgi:hypothetical protein
MKVLLLHPEDALSGPRKSEHWDLIVDLGRAPDSTYAAWCRRFGCEVFSIFRFAEEITDLRYLRDLMRLGNGRLLDHEGLDWWDLLCLFFTAELQQLILIQRLSQELRGNCELYCSRPSPLATSLQEMLGAKLTVLEKPFGAIFRRAQRYQKIISELDLAQVAQLLEDKFDGEHLIRRRFNRQPQSKSPDPVVLLPSAYVSVSRTAMAYAARCRDQQFLLVHTRTSGRLRSAPPNLRMKSLSPYFVSADQGEIASLLTSWNNLRTSLVSTSNEFNCLSTIGALDRIPGLLRWGIALRDAWSGLFDVENVIACLCADDSNPPSSIPMLLAKRRGLPALASHHGALDYQMAIKTNHADFYLAKNQMERDYLVRVCDLSSSRVVVDSEPPGNVSTGRKSIASATPWLVFFTEPYQSSLWRNDEVYRDLLPRLVALARTSRSQLVFKLHPFESVRGHRRLLRKHLGREEAGKIRVVGGLPSAELWRNIRFALTVQSTVALKCNEIGIPIFLCAWLRDSLSGYVGQYSRFNIGHVLKSPEQIEEIPGILSNFGKAVAIKEDQRRAAFQDMLSNILSGNWAPVFAVEG